jgi:hypothetical protein
MHLFLIRQYRESRWEWGRKRNVQIPNGVPLLECDISNFEETGAEAHLREGVKLYSGDVPASDFISKIRSSL